MRGTRNYLMATLAKVVYQFCSDQAAAANDHDLHAQPPRTVGPMKAAFNRIA
jgi:hypothetical protein